MPDQFKAEVFQNEYLPLGSGEVHAIMTVTALDAAVSPEPPGRLFGILCDVSGSMEGGKIAAAKRAMEKLVEMLPEDCNFFVIAGSHEVHLLAPVAAANRANKARALDAIRHIGAVGGTTISAWLEAALREFGSIPGGVKHALLLTDGQNEKEDADALQAALARCDGAFQCDCRGIGTDWEVEQLRQIAGKLLGTADIIPSPQQIEADFRAILEKAMAKSLSDVVLRLWTPQGATVKYCKQVSPDIMDLTSRARQPKPQIREYPTGAWAARESRDFHFCIEVQPGAAGDEVLAGRASLVHWSGGAETKVAEARILAIWTGDYAKSTRIDRVVAHYTGQAELAQSIQDGLEARARGDLETATVLLGRAVKLAHESGSEATAKLLHRVVDVQDAEKGTVRLKNSISKEDAMALDVRSTKTARLARGENGAAGNA